MNDRIARHNVILRVIAIFVASATICSCRPGTTLRRSASSRVIRMSAPCFIPDPQNTRALSESYTISGSGENMWFGIDDFQFVWKKVSGDVALSADISFVGDKGNNHRKAVLMIRQSLDGNSPSVDIARHGDGLTSLQFRDAVGADDHEVQSNVFAPKRMRLEKRGDYFYAFVTGKDGQLEPSGRINKACSDRSVLRWHRGFGPR